MTDPSYPTPCKHCGRDFSDHNQLVGGACPPRQRFYAPAPPEPEKKSVKREQRFVRIGTGITEMLVPWLDVLAAIPSLDPEQQQELFQVLAPHHRAVQMRDELSAAIAAKEAAEKETQTWKQMTALGSVERDRLFAELAEAESCAEYKFAIEVCRERDRLRADRDSWKARHEKVEKREAELRVLWDERHQRIAESGGRERKAREELGECLNANATLRTELRDMEARIAGLQNEREPERLEVFKPRTQLRTAVSRCDDEREKAEYSADEQRFAIRAALDRADCPSVWLEMVDSAPRVDPSHAPLVSTESAPFVRRDCISGPGLANDGHGKHLQHPAVAMANEAIRKENEEPMCTGFKEPTFGPAQIPPGIYNAVARGLDGTSRDEPAPSPPEEPQPVASGEAPDGWTNAHCDAAMHAAFGLEVTLLEVIKARNARIRELEAQRIHWKQHAEAQEERAERWKAQDGRTLRELDASQDEVARLENELDCLAAPNEGDSDD